jgi:hypothetical protein
MAQAFLKTLKGFTGDCANLSRPLGHHLIQDAVNCAVQARPGARIRPGEASDTGHRRVM